MRTEGVRASGAGAREAHFDLGADPAPRRWLRRGAGPDEGPLWWEEGGYLLFTDIHNNRRMKYQPGSGVSLFLEPTRPATFVPLDKQNPRSGGTKR